MTQQLIVKRARLQLAMMTMFIILLEKEVSAILSHLGNRITKLSFFFVSRSQQAERSQWWTKVL